MNSASKQVTIIKKNQQQQSKDQLQTGQDLKDLTNKQSSQRIREQTTAAKTNEVIVDERIGKIVQNQKYEVNDKHKVEDEDEYEDEDDDEESDDDEDDDDDDDEDDERDVREMKQFLMLEKIIDDEVVKMQMIEQLNTQSPDPDRTTPLPPPPTTSQDRSSATDSKGHKVASTGSAATIKADHENRNRGSALSIKPPPQPAPLAPQPKSSNRNSKNSASVSSMSSSSSWPTALPPITYDQLHKGRFVFDSVTFFDSFFGADELERYFPDRKLRLAILSWNMSSKAPADYNQTLQRILQLKMPTESAETLPELYAIGLQETPKSEVIVANIKIGIQAVLGPHYVLLQWSAVGALHASIWIRRELLWSCTTVEMVPVHSRPTAANRIRTKGAIALSFGIFGTSFLFINTHLSAHETNLRTRINQLDKVQQTLNINLRQFGGLAGHNQRSGKNSISSLHSSPLSSTSHAPKESSRSSQTDSPCKDQPEQKQPQQSQSDSSPPRRPSSEYIFWFGDLNFRLELPMENVLDAIETIANSVTEEERTNCLHQLMKSDQLTNLMARGMVFDGFNEALWPPPFLPTYKCLINGLSSTLSINLAGPGNGTNQKSAVSTKSVSSESNSSTQSIGSSSAVSSSSSSSSTNTTTIMTSSTTGAAVATTTTTCGGNDSTQQQTPAHCRETLLNIYNCESGRVPSYTDRILFQASIDYEIEDSAIGTELPPQQPEPNIQCLQYDAITSIGSSDHKPVYGLFEVRLESGGPRLPLRLRQLSESSDGTKLKKKKLVKELSFDLSLAATVPDQTGPDSGSGNSKNISFFGHRFNKKNSKQQAIGTGAKLQHHPLKDGRITSNLQQAAHAAMSASLSSLSLPTSSSCAALNSSQQQEQQYSMASLMAAATASKLDNLTRLNAGAFERQVFVDGLRLRNRLLQSYLSAAEHHHKQQQHQQQLQQRRASLFKSRSFDSNMVEQPLRPPASVAPNLTAPRAVSPISPLVDKQERQAFMINSNRSRMELQASVVAARAAAEFAAKNHHQHRTSSNVCRLM